MTIAKERLTYLLELAARGANAKPALAHELANALLDWPTEYSLSTRAPLEALLAKTIRGVDPETRAGVAARFAHRQDMPVAVLNELFFAASAEMKDEIVQRNADGQADASALPELDEASLLAAVRGRPESFAQDFALALCVPQETAFEILHDASGRALALTLKGAHATRATYSAIAVLIDRVRSAEDSYLRLASFDVVPQGAADNMLAFWRAHRAGDAPPLVGHAAE